MPADLPSISSSNPRSWIYLSPHFDDIALSCGGLIWEQVRSGDVVSVWTLCADEPPSEGLSSFAQSLHRRWNESANENVQGKLTAGLRRQEDLASCRIMGANPRHFDLLDCIYRTSPEGTHIYTSESAIFGPVHPIESPLIEQLGEQLAKKIPKEAQIVCPLGLGGHVDHRLVRQATERLKQPLWYYLDYPYVLDHAEQISTLVEPHWTMRTYPISPAGLAAWGKAITAHISQISSFWTDLESMYAALSSYLQEYRGVVLWRS